jgi:hypothetical protein
MTRHPGAWVRAGVLGRSDGDTSSPDSWKDGRAHRDATTVSHAHADVTSPAVQFHRIQVTGASAVCRPIHGPIASGPDPYLTRTSDAGLDVRLAAEIDPFGQLCATCTIHTVVRS